MNIRPMTPDDYPVATDIFYESFNDLQHKRGLKGEDRSDNETWLGDFLAHLAVTDPRSSLIAEDDAGAPLGFTAAYRRESFWFLSFLFVMPGVQLSGIGRSLLETVLPPEGEQAGMELATVIESIQPISAGLYARYGMTPRVPRFAVTGADPAKMPSLRSSLRSTPMTTDLIPAASEIDRALLGYVRPEDHAMMQRKYSGTAFTEDGGGLVGYAYADGEGAGPIAAAAEADLAGIVSYTLASQDAPLKMEITILGTSGELFRNLLDAGARMGPASSPFIYCSSEPNRPRPGYITYAGYMP